MTRTRYVPDRGPTTRRVAGMAVEAAPRSGVGRAGRQANTAGLVLLLGPLVSAVVYARAGALLLGWPPALAPALTGTSGEMSRFRVRFLVRFRDVRRQEAVNSYAFATALSGETLATVMSSHPSPDIRLARLDRISGRLVR